MRDVGHELAAELLRPRKLAYPDALAVESEEEYEHSRRARESGKDEQPLRATERSEHFLARADKPDDIFTA